MTGCVKLTKNLTYSEFLDSKSDALLKTCFKIWFFSKVFKRNCFFFHTFHQWVVFEKTHNCKNWRFHGLKISEKCFSESKTFDKVCFCTNQFHFKIWCVVRLFFRNVTHSKISDSNFPEFWEIGSKSDAFKILDSKYYALYIKWFKKWLSSKILIQNFFMNKNHFLPEQLFQECTKKPTLTFLRC